MAAPGAFDFRAQLQDILKTFQIEGGVLRKAAGLGHAVFVGFGGDFRGEMRFFGQQRQDFIFVGGRYEPALRFEDSGEKARSEEHTSELQSQSNLVCRLLLEKKKRDSVL